MDITYLDRVRGICHILGIGDAASVEQRPGAIQAALHSIQSGAAFRSVRKFAFARVLLERALILVIEAPSNQISASFLIRLTQSFFLITLISHLRLYGENALVSPHDKDRYGVQYSC